MARWHISCDLRDNSPANDIRASAGETEGDKPLLLRGVRVPCRPIGISVSLKRRDLKILVVEDDQGIADLICWVLQDAGFQVFAETGIAAAKRAIDVCHPRVVITDLVLPDGLGSDFINQLKTQPDNEEVASVLISAHPQALAHAKASRADAYLPKPFDLDDLNRVVGDLVGVD